MTKKELIEKLKDFQDDAEIYIFENHFETYEKLDGVENIGEWGSKPDGNIYFHFWAK